MSRAWTDEKRLERFNDRDSWPHTNLVNVKRSVPFPPPTRGFKIETGVVTFKDGKYWLRVDPYQLPAPDDMGTTPEQLVADGWTFD